LLNANGGFVLLSILAAFPVKIVTRYILRVSNGASRGWGATLVFLILGIVTLAYLYVILLFSYDLNSNAHFDWAMLGAVAIGTEIAIFDFVKEVIL
jgi:hypothetical protein